MEANGYKLIDILLIEDSPGDVRLVQEALKESKFRNNLMIARDGEEAMAILHQEADFSHYKRPDLILLDLNLPKKDGREVLAEIKSDENLKRIPVIVLTTSKAEEDILRSYNLYANSYITKPVGVEQFIRMVKELEEFWLGIVKLPPK